MRDRAEFADLPRRLSHAALHRAGGRLLRVGGAQPTHYSYPSTASGKWLRTFAIITTDANELVANIHDRMPVILAPSDYAQWLGEEADPPGLMRQFPADLMRMWPISIWVNKPENDDPSILEPIKLPAGAA